MPSTDIDLTTWSRAETFHWFRSFGKPHYAVTCRVDVTRLMTTGKARGISPFHGCLYAIGSGLHAVDALRTRFKGTRVVQHDAIALSFAVPRDIGGFGFAWVDWHQDFAQFEPLAAAAITATQRSTELAPNESGADDVAYLSCLPWLDFTGLDHAVREAADCIPRVSWGKITAQAEGDRFSMPVNIQVHHAMTDGAHLGAFYEALQRALDQF